MGRHAKRKSHATHNMLSGLALALMLLIPSFASTASVHPTAAPVAPPQSLVVSPEATTAPLARDGYSAGQYFFSWPVPCPWAVTDDVGGRIAPVAGASTNHSGTDIVCQGSGNDYGVPILAISSGIVIDAQALSYGKGWHLTVQHVVPDGSFIAVYAHCIEGSILVAPGQPVALGQQLCSMGSTGASTGPHLHLELYLNGSSSPTSATDFFESVDEIQGH